MFEASVYTNRRNVLRNKIQSGLILILGNNDSPMNYPANPYHFRQDSSFLYFFGLDFPGLAGVIDIDENKDHIFGDDVDIDDIIWMGPQAALKEKAVKVGIENTAPFSEINTIIKKAKDSGRKIHFPTPYRPDNKILLESILNIPVSGLKENVSVDLVRGVVDLRSVKEEVEIIEIEKACKTGYEMHTTAMKMAKPGIYEREIAGVIEGISLAHGGYISFPVILSQNGQTLHNHDHSQMLETGRLMLVDAGTETTLHYASDNTRTVPVGGRFTPKQKDIYNIVLETVNKSITAIKPDVFYRDVHHQAARIITGGLKELGLMKGDIDEAVTKGAHAMFFPHGLGHMMGLDVHDMEDLGEDYVGYDENTKRSDQFGTAYLRMGKKIKPGYVLTIEPGIYFIPELIDKWQSENKFTEFINYDKVNEYRGFGGIRLEDDILVTGSGCRILGPRIPISINEVEEIMSS